MPTPQEVVAALAEVAHRAADVADVEQPDLARSTAAKEWLTKGYRPGLVDLDVEDAAAAGGHVRRLHVVQRAALRSASTQARSRIVPTMWKSVSMLGPASTTQNRTVSPGFAVSGCFTYWPA